MKVVKVYGALRKRLGQCRFEFDVATPAQAIKALCVNFPGLDKWLIDSEQDGVGYRVAVSKEKVTKQDMSPLFMPFSEKEVFSITPVITGAGRGTGSILLGVGLIAASIFIPGATPIFGTTFGKISLSVGLAGGSLVLGGIAQAISPQPNLYDFNFLAPCPASGLIVQGKKDDLVPPEETTRLAEKLKSQKNITVDYEEITGANHFYDNETDKLEKTIRSYIERELNSKYR